MKTKIQLISILASPQILTQNHSRGKERNQDCEKLNRNSKIEKRSVVHDNDTQEPCKCTRFINTPKNIIIVVT